MAQNQSKDVERNAQNITRDKDGFQSLATNLVIQGKRQAVSGPVAIVSPESNEDTTVVAANLAKALHDIGKSVMFVDSNVEQPNIIGLLNNDDPCLVRLNEKSISTASDKFKSGRLFFVAIEGVDNPVKFLQSGEFVRFIKEATSTFDFVLIDSPALLESATTKAILVNVPNALLVVKKQITRIRSLDDCVTTLKEIGTKIIGYTRVAK